MTEQETAYLQMYRQLDALRAGMEEAVGYLRGVCESLKSWRSTAEELATFGGTNASRAWDGDRLSALADLRNRLTAYHAARRDLSLQWGRLKGDQRLGLSPPEALDQ